MQSFAALAQETAQRPRSSWSMAPGQRPAFCPICRTRGCAHLEKLETEIKLQQSLHSKREIFGASPPNLFVGYYGYPQVDVGPLVALQSDVDASLFDNPASWYGKNLQEIVRFRSLLARGKQRHAVRQSNRQLEDIQEVVLSKSTVDLEVRFRKELHFSVAFSPVTQPMGPSGEMEHMRIAGNTIIPRKVDQLMEENLKTRQAVSELMRKDFDFYYLQKLLSAGIFGESGRKKLVPTRWSITATDKMVADEHIGKIKLLPLLPEVRVYFNEYLYNRFHVLLIPGSWEFEQFEAWQKGSSWNPGSGNAGASWEAALEYEPFEGRSDYAEKESGGYYAGRLGVAEALAKKLKKQAKVIVLREIGKDYNLPVGVWEVRENVRHAFDKEPWKFQSAEEAKVFLRARLQRNVNDYWRESRILPQKRLLDFS